MCMAWFTSLAVVIIVLVSQFNTLYSEGDCFQVNPKECASLNSCKCRIQPQSSAQASEGNLVYCCNVTSTENLEQNLHCAGGAANIKALHILLSNLSILEATTLMSPKMVNLAITDNNISEIHGNFKLPELACLNLSSNSLLEVDPGILHYTTKLAMFDISSNNITSLPILFKHGYPRLDVSKNKQLYCSSLLNAVEDLRRNKINEEDKFMYTEMTICAPSGLQWVVKEVFPFRVIQDTKSINRDCPVINDAKCECSVHSLDYGRDVGEFSFSTNVDCSNRGLTSLPNTLPENTYFLNISSNNITSLEGIGNHSYSMVKELYADNNQISSLKPLEGSKFLYSFSKLSLRRNNINSLQQYIFRTVLDHNKLFLGNNKFNCNCDTDKQLKPWLLLQKIKDNIPDGDEIFCQNFHNTRVIDLNSQLVCPTETNWKDYIKYIIGVEIILLLLLIAKVSYDYYVFKNAGYLPWPASKMPKLPCDWCFET